MNDFLFAVIVTIGLIIGFVAWIFIKEASDNYARKKVEKLVEEAMKERAALLEEYKIRAEMALAGLEGDTDVVIDRVMLVFGHLFDEPVWTKEYFYVGEEEKMTPFYEKEINRVRGLIAKNFNVESEEFLAKVADRLNRMQLGGK